VKILIFGTLLLLGVLNQFWIHPRIVAMRVAGDRRPLHVILVRQFPATLTIETLLGMAQLFVAPFLHGSARNQAFQANLAKNATTSLTHLPKIPAKEATATTLVWGTTETTAVIAVMIAGYWLSGKARPPPYRRRIGGRERQPREGVTARPGVNFIRATRACPSCPANVWRHRVGRVRGLPLSTVLGWRVMMSCARRAGPRKPV
jgi:hypothetical protein